MLWTINHVLNTEARLQKLAADAYKLAAENVWWDMIMSQRPGDGAKQEIEWLLTTADIYRLNSKGDGIRFDDLVTQAHSVTHEDFGTGLNITRNQWEDDAFGFAGDWARQIGSRMSLDPQYEAINMILNGETQNGYDGQPFYSIEHPVNPYKDSVGTYDTLITDVVQLDSSLGSADPDLTAANLVLGVAYIKTIKMPNGRNRNLRPKILRVAPALEKTALELTSAAFIGATENVIRKYQLEVLVVNELADEPQSWYLDCVVGETPDLLPFVRFERRSYEMTSFNGMTQAELARRNELEWQLRGRYGYMYGHPYQSYKFKKS
jgi:phage major head subunit gpT-like protein